MKYKNYIFDLYGTLVDIRTEEDAPQLWEKLALFYGYYDAAYTPGELKTRFKCLVAGKEADTHEAFPEIQIEEVFETLYTEKGVQPNRDLAVHTGQFFRVLSTEYVRLYDGAKELLSSIRAAGGRIYLLSNAQRIFTEYELHTLGIIPYFDDIFISSEYGVKKPEEKFFKMLLDKHGIQPAESVMIGNDMKSDIGGAKKVGLSTFYIHSNISPELTGEPVADDVLMEMDLRQVQKMLEI
jgi:putative hydrolase of the HAD superfamily